VGKQNALTVSTHITDTDVLFDVYDKDFKKITLSYLDYLNKKVAASESVDYDTNTLKPDEDGKVTVKYRMKRIKVPVEEVELIDLHPDYRLSEEVRRIPFVNYTDSVRIHMGSSMLKQSIPLTNAERPLVDTGNTVELNDNVLNEKFREEEGTVKEINEESVVIELPNKDTVEVPRRTAIQSVNDVDVYTEPKVKVGDKVKKGDVITGAVGLEKDTYKAGINANVLFHAMFGYVNEDALVVSESFSKKMCSYSVIDLCIDVKTTEAIKWIAPIGTRVKSSDSVVIIHKAVRLDEINRQLQDKLSGIFGDERDLSEYTIENSLKVPNNIEEAYVSDVLVQENKKPKINKGMKMPDLTFSHTSKDVIDEYMGNKDRRKVIYEKYPEYIASDVLDPVSLEDKSYKVVYTVRVRLIKRTNLMVGSKLTNRYGGKGVISKILPDNEMPVQIETSTGKQRQIDVVMNPYSTINRKIPSVNMEQLLSSCAVKIHDLVEERKDNPKQKDSIMNLMKKYYPGRYDSMDVDEFIKYHETHRLEDVYYFNVGSFSTKFTPKLIDEWADELGVTPQSKILIPTKTVSDLKELKESLSEKEYDEVVKGLEGKYTVIDKPLSCGPMNLIELYHIPTYSNKVTSSMFGIDVNEYKDSPIMGRGKYRMTGQKIDKLVFKLRELLELIYRISSVM
jgi:DNA-directed RNA polymerase beta subunit